MKAPTWKSHEKGWFARLRDRIDPDILAVGRDMRFMWIVFTAGFLAICLYSLWAGANLTASHVGIAILGSLFLATSLTLIVAMVVGLGIWLLKKKKKD